LTDRNNFCNIGRLAEVRFERVRFGFLDRLGKVLGWNSGRPDNDAVAKPVASQ
jgi:hypothetical protein